MPSFLDLDGDRDDLDLLNNGESDGLQPVDGLVDTKGVGG